MSVIIDRITDGAPVGRCVRGGTYTGMTRKTPGEPCSPVIVSTSGGGASETVSDPTLSGSTSGTANVSYDYTASGSTSSLGHSLEYYFDWGDGSNSGWGSSTASHSWFNAGAYNARVKARCASDTSEVSAWSSTVAVAIADVNATFTSETKVSRLLRSAPFVRVALGEALQALATIPVTATFTSETKVSRGGLPLFAFRNSGAVHQ